MNVLLPSHSRGSWVVDSGCVPRNPWNLGSEAVRLGYWEDAPYRPGVASQELSRLRELSTFAPKGSERLGGRYSSALLVKMEEAICGFAFRHRSPPSAIHSECVCIAQDGARPPYQTRFSGVCLFSLRRPTIPLSQRDCHSFRDFISKLELVGESRLLGAVIRSCCVLCLMCCRSSCSVRLKGQIRRRPRG